MPAPYEGGCICGAVRYRLTSEPLTFYACHCTNCRRYTGTAFGLSMPVLKSAVELLRGEPAAYDVALDEGRRSRGAFCAACVTRLWNEPARAPELLVLRPGTLDDIARFHPVAHIWTRSALPWVVIPEEALRFGQQPPFTTLMEAWRDRTK